MAFEVKDVRGLGNEDLRCTGVQGLQGLGFGFQFAWWLKTKSVFGIRGSVTHP